MRSLTFLFLAILFSCTNEDGARRALTGAGYLEIELGGADWSACGDDDTCTKFTAIGPTGKRVRGAVGCGFSGGCNKGCTIRTY